MSGLRFVFPGFLEAEPGADVPPTPQASPLTSPQHQWEADLAELSGEDEPNTEEPTTFSSTRGLGDRQFVSPTTANAPPSALLSLPDSVLSLIFGQLHWRDVCALHATSHSARQLASSEAVWETVYDRHRAALLRLPQHEPPAPPLTSYSVAGAQRLSYASARNRHGQQRALEGQLSQVGGALPRSMVGPMEERPQCHQLHEHGCCARSLILARSMAVASAVGVSFHGLRQAHDQVRCVLDRYWIDPSSVSSDNIRRLMMKLTRFSWSLAYECVVGAFLHCADCVAAGVGMQLRTAQPTGPEAGVGPMGEGASCTCSTCVSWQRMSLAGALSLWDWLLQQWVRYRRWLVGLLSFCPALNDLVSAERAAEYMSRGELLGTPTLFDRGIAAFRSQVMVRFELRPALQTALSLVYTSRQEDLQAGSTLIDAWRLLLDLNVPDDTTESETFHTQEAFLNCYGMTTSSFRDINRGKLNIPLPR